MRAYLFDKRQGEIVDDWAGSLQHLSTSQVLWLDLQDASHEQAAEVFEALDLGDATELRLGDPDKAPEVDQHEGHLRVTAVAVSDDERDPERERIVVDCFVGSNWVLTVHTADIAALDEFRSGTRRGRAAGCALVSLDGAGMGGDQLSPCLR